MKNRRNPKPQSRRLFVESLERREVLAGNVTATLVGGLLTVTGDPAANRVVIWQNTNTGLFSVTGQNQVTPTKINNIGAGNNTVTFPGSVTSIYVDMKAGADFVTIARGTSATNAAGAAGTAAEVPGSIWVYGGNDSDTISISVNGGTDPTFDLPLPTAAVIVDGGYQASGTQNDTVTIRNSFIGAAAITTYLGNDNVTVQGSVIASLAINTGWFGAGLDNDNVTLNGLASFSTSVAMGNSGTTSALDNTLTINNALLGALVVTGGSGVDTVNIGATGQVGVVNTVISLLGGADTVIIRDFQAGLTNDDFQTIAALLGPLPFGYDQLIASFPGIPGSLVIDAGAGIDDVRLTNVTVTSSLYVYLGAGDDQFRTTNVTAFIAYIDGGLDTDRRSAAGLVADYLYYFSFEGPNNLT